MNRTDIINFVITTNSYKRYLEIGVKARENFNKVIIDHKDGVDPKGRCNYVMTSDEFFKRSSKHQMYDIIFIDGLHTRAQAERDISNSLIHLLPNGTIVVHDCNPIKEKHLSLRGNGTVWEAFVKFRMTRDDLFMCVVDTDCGCGIIKRGTQKLFPNTKLSYGVLVANRSAILNLISVDSFCEMENLSRTR